MKDTNIKKFHDDDVSNVLKDDGVNKISIEKKYENLSKTSLKDIKNKFGEGSWAVRVVYNELFGGVLIQQKPGEGNRLHFHPDADECWVILEGEWEWYIEGEGKKTVGVNDIVVVKKGVRHQIKCIGSNTGIRLAITRPDVNHVYDN